MQGKKKGDKLGSTSYDYLFKIIMIGDASVGKSNLLLRYTKNTFNEDQKATIGVEFQTKSIKKDDGKILKAQLWDTAGQEKYKSLVSAYYRGAVGVCVVFDVTNFESFRSVSSWLKEVKKSCNPNTVILLIGNKCDLEENRVVRSADVAKYAQEHQLAYVETSAKLSLNVDSAFEMIIDEIYRVLKTNGQLDNQGDAFS